MAAIEACGLTKRFGSVLAVDHLDFQLNSGTATGFLGPNGAGKTTTLRVLLGLVKPTEGSAIINSTRYADLAHPLREVGAVLEAANAHPGRTARNHLRIQARTAGAPLSRVGEVLELVELTDTADRRVGSFSLGMRQRLGLAAALIGDPHTLILDEPANGLDPEGVRWLRNLLHSLTGEGRTVLVSSHILAEVAQTVDAVLIIDHGRLVAQSTLEDLTGGVQETVHVRTPQPGELRAILAKPGVTAQVTSSGQVEVRGVTAEQVGMIAAREQIPIFGMTAGTANLEDVFLRLITDDRDRANDGYGGPGQ
jgi:ABC-2 type transport system ATP-binding protein